MMIIRGAQAPMTSPNEHNEALVTDPLQDQVAVVFAAKLAADRVPSIRAIRSAPCRPAACTAIA